MQLRASDLGQVLKTETTGFRDSDHNLAQQHDRISRLIIALNPFTDSPELSPFDCTSAHAALFVANGVFSKTRIRIFLFIAATEISHRKVLSHTSTVSLRRLIDC